MAGILLHSHQLDRGQSPIDQITLSLDPTAHGKMRPGTTARAMASQMHTDQIITETKGTISAVRISILAGVDQSRSVQVMTVRHPRLNLITTIPSRASPAMISKNRTGQANTIQPRTVHNIRRDKVTTLPGRTSPVKVNKTKTIPANTVPAAMIDRVRTERATMLISRTSLAATSTMSRSSMRTARTAPRRAASHQFRVRTKELKDIMRRMTTSIVVPALRPDSRTSGVGSGAGVDAEAGVSGAVSGATVGRLADVEALVGRLRVAEASAVMGGERVDGN